MENLKIEAELSEYKTLREEILFNLRSVLQIYMFTVLAVSGIFSYGMVGQNGFVFLVGPVIVAASLLNATSYYSSMVRIATYIRCVLEKRVPGLNWETTMMGFRNKKVYQWRIIRLRQIVSIAIIHDVLAAGCAAAALAYGDILLIAPILAILFLFVAYSNMLFLEVTSIKNWESAEKFIKGKLG